MDAVRKERRNMWNAIPNLHIVGDIVEAVRIRCRYAVIVMIHCHLSFQQIMSSVECDTILGVLSLPCCNFFEVQKQFMGQDPSFEWFFSRFLTFRFNDKAIWSEKNTVRIWVQPAIRWEGDYVQSPCGHACTDSCIPCP